MTALPESPQPLSEARFLTRISLYAALIGIGAFLHIPFGPMHISLQPMMVNLTGFRLGVRQAGWALLLYNFCGFVGLPMFGRGKAGPASFLGPTAGYFVGFLVSAMISGLARRYGRTRRGRFVSMLIFGGIGSTAALVCGSLLLYLRFIPDFSHAFMVGFVPFILGDLVKVVAAAVISDRVFPGSAS